MKVIKANRDVTCTKVDTHTGKALATLTIEWHSPAKVPPRAERVHLLELLSAAERLSGGEQWAIFDSGVQHGGFPLLRATITCELIANEDKPRAIVMLNALAEIAAGTKRITGTALVATRGAVLDTLTNKNR